MKKHKTILKVISIILIVAIIVEILPMTVLDQAVEDEKEKFEQRADIQAMFLRRKRIRP